MRLFGGPELCYTTLELQCMTFINEAQLLKEWTWCFPLDKSLFRGKQQLHFWMTGPMRKTYFLTWSKLRSATRQKRVSGMFSFTLEKKKKMKMKTFVPNRSRIQDPRSGSETQNQTLHILLWRTTVISCTYIVEAVISGHPLDVNKVKWKVNIFVLSCCMLYSLMKSVWSDKTSSEE